MIEGSEGSLAGRRVTIFYYCQSGRISSYDDVLVIRENIITESLTIQTASGSLVRIPSTATQRVIIGERTNVVPL